MELLWPLLVVVGLLDRPVPEPVVPAASVVSTQKASAPRHRFKLPVDLPVTIVAGLGAKALSRGQAGVDPDRSPVLRCRWCDTTESGDLSLNGVDSWGNRARWDNAGRADRLSDSVYGLTVVGVVAPLVFRKTSWAQRFEESGLVIQSAAVSLLVAQVSKINARRARPYTHDGSDGRALESSDNWSFFSGHSALAFTVVAASRSMAASRSATTSKRLWTYIGFPVASAIGYLRIASGEHYLTDVLTGAAVGVAVGTWLPQKHFGTDQSRGQMVAVRPSPSGTGIEVVIVW